MKDQLKVVIIGNCNCGKTSIITRIDKNTFTPEYTSTEGITDHSIDLTYVEFNNRTLRMELWDTAGQEKYRSLTSIIYKDADAAILVYDITNNESFTALKQYWLNEIKENCPSDIVIAVAGNKSDLVGQVDEEEVRRFVEENEIVFKNTSAVDNSGIKELFRDVGKVYLKRYLEEDEQQVNEEEGGKEEDGEKKEGTGKKLKGGTGHGHEKKKCC